MTPEQRDMAEQVLLKEEQRLALMKKAVAQPDAAYWDRLDLAKALLEQDALPMLTAASAPPQPAVESQLRDRVIELTRALERSDDDQRELAARFEASQGALTAVTADRDALLKNDDAHCVGQCKSILGATPEESLRQVTVRVVLAQKALEAERDGARKSMLENHDFVARQCEKLAFDFAEEKAKLVEERDKHRAALSVALNHTQWITEGFDQAQSALREGARERDALRAEVERLKVLRVHWSDMSAILFINAKDGAPAVDAAPEACLMAVRDMLDGARASQERGKALTAAADEMRAAIGNGPHVHGDHRHAAFAYDRARGLQPETNALVAAVEKMHAQKAAATWLADAADRARADEREACVNALLAAEYPNAASVLRALDPDVEAGKRGLQRAPGEPKDSPAARGVYAEVAAERARAHEKHGDTSMEAAAPLAPRRLAILMEEVGEIAREYNEADNNRRPIDAAAVRSECIQVAAMAAAWADALPGEKP
jgi:hypothetical protein